MKGFETVSCPQCNRVGAVRVVHTKRYPSFIKRRHECKIKHDGCGYLWNARQYLPQEPVKPVKKEKKGIRNAS